MFHLLPLKYEVVLFLFSNSYLFQAYVILASKSYPLEM